METTLESNPQTTTWLGVAFVNQKQHKKNQGKLAKNYSCCSVTAAGHKIKRIYDSYQSYVHCEIAFPLHDGSQNCLAYAVFRNGVNKMERTFSNPAYKWILLDINESEYAAVVKFCDAQVNKPFDVNAASWKLLIWPPESDQKKWWCASFVHAALRSIGILTQYRVNTLDVDDIQKLVTKSPRKIKLGMTPYECKKVSDEFTRDLFHVNNSQEQIKKEKKLLSC